MKKMIRVKGFIELDIYQARKLANENMYKKPIWLKDENPKKNRVMIDCIVSEEFIKNEPDALEEVLKMKMANELKRNMKVVEYEYIEERNEVIE